MNTPVFLSGEFHGQRSLVGYSSWGHQESETTLLVCTELNHDLKPGARRQPAAKTCNQKQQGYNRLLVMGAPFESSGTGTSWIRAHLEQMCTK